MHSMIARGLRCGAALSHVPACHRVALVPRAAAARLLSSDASKPAASNPDASDSTAVTDAPLTNARGEVIKTWGSSVELPAVTQKEAQEAYLDATDVVRAMNPPIATAVAARDDMLKDRFNYVSNNLNPASQYIVAGADGKSVAPAAIGQASFLMAGIMVLLGSIGAVVYIKTQWGVSSAMELGDRLREKGAERRATLERSNSANVVRAFSQKAETTVKGNVELVRRPSQELGQHFQESFKGVVKENR